MTQENAHIDEMDRQIHGARVDMKAALARFDDDVLADVRAIRKAAGIEEHARRRPFARTDMALGVTSVVLGAAVAAAGIMRPQANIPIYVYGVVLILLGILLFNAGRRR